MGGMASDGDAACRSPDGPPSPDLKVLQLHGLPDFLPSPGFVLVVGR
jgi:hypothetical protein